MTQSLSEGIGPAAAFPRLRQPGGNPPRLLVAGFFAPRAGLGRVTWTLARALAADWDVHFFGIDHHGEILHRSGVTLHPRRTKGIDLYGYGDWSDLVEELQPAAVLLVNDLNLLGGYVESLRRCAVRPRVVAYSPVDGELHDPEILLSLQGLDRMVVYGAFGAREIQQAARRLNERSPDFSMPRLASVPHGVDRDVFHPLTAPGDRERCRLARQWLFPERPELHRGWWVLNANTLTPRKCLETTLWGFAEFARDKPADVRLYLHHLHSRQPRHRELLSLADRLGIAGRLIPSLLEQGGGRPVSDRRMNLLYNACEVGVNTSMGEGWGLVSFEHAATGAAQIVPGHSAPGDLWRGAAPLLSPKSKDPGGPVAAMQRVSSQDLGRELENLYLDPERLRSVAQDCFQRAALDGWTWEQIGRMWRELFKDLRTSERKSGKESRWHRVDLGPTC
jgi:glycosyltransferase involved in cell wall biosynthesis